MKKKSSIIRLSVISALIIIGFLIMFVPVRIGIFDFNGLASRIRLGLDLSGGVAAVYRADLPADAEVDFETAMSGTMTSLQNTLMARGFTEATIQREGGQNLRVSVPDIDDPSEVLRILGSPAQIEFVFRGTTIIYGRSIVHARAQFDGMSYAVALAFDAVGTRAFSEATAQAVANNNEPIEIWSVFGDGTNEGDRRMISAPAVQNHITNGQAVISGGDGSRAWAEELAGQIAAGQMPLILTRLEFATVSATLGEGAIMFGLIAGAIGIALVIAFITFFYGILGIAGALTLLLYTVMLITLLALFPWVQLTLPGIAGVLLSIGMAMDGEIIIFERMKDEYRNGKSILSSFHYGFRKSIRAIVDANITTAVAAIVLFIMGTGPVQGFAMTLLLGIPLGVFNSLVLARFNIGIMIGLNQSNPKLYRFNRSNDYKDLGADKDSAAAAMQIEEENRLKRERREREIQERAKRAEGGAL